VKLQRLKVFKLATPRARELTARNDRVPGHDDWLTGPITSRAAIGVRGARDKTQPGCGARVVQDDTLRAAAIRSTELTLIRRGRAQDAWATGRFERALRVWRDRSRKLKRPLGAAAGAKPRSATSRFFGCAELFVGEQLAL